MYIITAATVLVALVAILMARKGGFPARYMRGGVREQLSLGTLASETLISTAFADSVTEQTRISSVVARYSISNLTPASGDGPILVGLALSDYTDAEIEAFVENTEGWQEGSMVGQEVADRRIRRVGIFPSPTANNIATVLNDGKPIKTKMNWTLTTGQTIKLWCYNLGSSALASTDPSVNCEGHANLWPQ